MANKALTKFEEVVLRDLLRQSLAKEWFDVCAIRKAFELLKDEQFVFFQDCPNSEVLHALHCVDFSKMSQEVKDGLPEAILEALGLNPFHYARYVKYPA